MEKPEMTVMTKVPKEKLPQFKKVKFITYKTRFGEGDVILTNKMPMTIKHEKVPEFLNKRIDGYEFDLNKGIHTTKKVDGKIVTDKTVSNVLIYPIKWMLENDNSDSIAQLKLRWFDKLSWKFKEVSLTPAEIGDPNILYKPITDKGCIISKKYMDQLSTFLVNIYGNHIIQLEKSKYVKYAGSYYNSDINEFIILLPSQTQYKYELMPNPKDAGYNSMLTTMKKTKGTLEGFKGSVIDQLVEWNAHKPIVAILAVLASPLLKFLKAESFVVNLHGSTSTGKSFIAEICTSMLGGYEGALNKLSSNWGDTPNSILGKFSRLNGFALPLDDASKLDADKRGKNIQKTIYDMTSSQSKGRMTAEANLQDTNIQSGIMISTCEANVLDYCLAAGTATRVINITVDNLWGKYTDNGSGDNVTDESMEAFRIMRQRMEDNSGSMMEAWANLWNSFNAEQLAILKRLYDKIESEYGTKYSSKVEELRVVKHYATLEWARVIANKHLHLNIPDILPELIEYDLSTNASLNKVYDDFKTVIEFGYIKHIDELYTGGGFNCTAVLDEDGLWIHTTDFKEKCVEILKMNKKGEAKIFVDKLYQKELFSLIDVNGRKEKTKQVRIKKSNPWCHLVTLETLKELGLN